MVRVAEQGVLGAAAVADGQQRAAVAPVKQATQGECPRGHSRCKGTRLLYILSWHRTLAYTHISWRKA